MQPPRSAGGFHALAYVWRLARRVGPWRLFNAMRTRNSCKTCALGMGGQKGGMVDEQGHWPEVCKKSFQAMAYDLQPGIDLDSWKNRTQASWESMSPRELEESGRLTRPLLWEDGAQTYQPISWERAFSLMTEVLGGISPEQAFFYFSGRSSNEAGFLLSVLARLYGSNHVNNCSYYCHQASGVGLSQSIGVGTATLQVQDIEQADLFFLIGGNPASNHPRLMSHLMRMKRRGGKVIVINPVKETGLVKFRIPSDVRSMLWGTKIADEYLMPHIGGDVALMLGIAKEIVAQDGQDHAFIARMTEGFAGLRKLLDETSWDHIEEASGVKREDIRHVGQMLVRSRKAVFSWTMGITHHLHGVENVQWIVNLALLTGMLGKPGAGLLPIRGHSNVQGMGTVGVVPVWKPDMAQRFEAWAGRMPQHEGFDTQRCMDASVAGDMKFGLALGGNLYGANPDAQYAKRALGALDLMVYLSTSLNTGHVHGRGKSTLILPVLARDEEPYASTQESMFSYVRLSVGGKPRHMGPMSEVDVICSLGQHLNLKTQNASEAIDWQDLRSGDSVRRLMARIVPGMEPVGAMGKTKEEFHIAGRRLGRDQFPTASGKAVFHAHKIPKMRAPHELCLMTVRSEGQFNTIVYEEDDFYRGQERRDVILMNEGDMQRLGLVPNECVDVRSEAGRMEGLFVRPYDIRQGNALMYYPEANVLVPRQVDPLSKTPAYKAVVVCVEKSKSLSLLGNSRPAERSSSRWQVWRRSRQRSQRPQMKTC